MKKLCISMLMLLTVFTFTVAAQGSSEAAPVAAASNPIVLKLSEVHAEGYPTSLADHEFARLVEEKTNGRIKIEVYTGGTLYGEETGSIEALQAGDLAFCRVSASPVASYVPAINAIQLPYLYKNSKHEWAVLDGAIGQKMLADIQASGSGLIGLCYYDSGCRSFYLTKEVHQVSDMKGLKIRMQNNKMMVRMVELLGATGVTGIGPNDVYSAITQGTVDGAENNWPTYQNMGDYEAAKNYILDGHTRVPEILLGSVAALKKISAADMDIIKQCAKDTEEFEKKAWAEKEASSEKIVREKGTNVIELTPAALAEFQSKMAPLYTEYGKGYEDIIKQIQDIGKNY
ncbi:MAG: TRAP transporter substrate-binding protein [Sphaerochaetaceae bacterium]